LVGLARAAASLGARFVVVAVAIMVLIAAVQCRSLSTIR
jgi:hypothetical protein